MMKTVVRILYILATAAIISAGLYWYWSVSAASEISGQPAQGEIRRAGQGSGTGSQPAGDKAGQGSHGDRSPDDGGIHFGGAHDLLGAETEVLVLIRNLVWVAGMIILVLLLQAGWRRLAKIKSKANTGSA